MIAFVAASVAITTLVAPWLVWTPAVHGPTATLLFGAASLVAAFHGWGRIVARVAARDRDGELDSALVVQWGIAAVIAVAGLLLVLDRYDARLLVVAGIVAHTADGAMRFEMRRAWWADTLAWSRARFWLVPALLLATLGCIHVLAGAGAIGDRPYDDDGNVVAQAARLATTGGLGDALGYPRIVQLGGRVAIDGLVTVFADASAIGMAEGLAFVLLLWLVCSRMRLRDATAAILATVVVITASALALTWPDRLPLWLPAGLVTAAVFTLQDLNEDWRARLPAALVAAALAVVRHELAPFAVVLGVAVVSVGKTQPLRRDPRRLLVVGAVFAIVVGAYALARWSAWSEVDAAVRPLLARRGSVVTQLAMSLVIGAAVAPLLLLIVPRETGVPALRWFAFAAAAAIGGVAGRLTAERLVGTRVLWALAIAGLVILAVEVVRRRVLDTSAFAIVVLLCVFAYEGRATPGRTGWSWRYWELLHDVEYARHGAGSGAEYERALSHVPAGARVAVWVRRPDLVDHARHRIVDLRTPRIARLRTATAADTRLRRLVRASRARYLLVEADEGYVGYSQRNPLQDALCAMENPAPACMDTLEALVHDGHVVGAVSDLTLVELAR